VAPYLALLPEDAGQRRYELREVFNAVRWIVRAGAPWRLLPHELPPWPVVYQQTQRWIAAGCFEAMVHDLRALLRLSTALRRSSRQWCWMVARCSPRPKAATGAGYDGHRRSVAPRPTWRWTHSGTCWRWWSPPLRSRSDSK
jgi:transposase